MNMKNDLNPDFSKYTDGLVPTIIQDYMNGQVLMLGFMNAEAFEKTLSEKKVTFYSRSKQRLWQKGESSGNYLELKTVSLDCDNDSILIQAKACGPTCHTGELSCFNSRQDALNGASIISIIGKLTRLISDRRHNPQVGSYVNSLLSGSLSRVAQKVGEEGLETALAAVAGDRNELKSEAADLLFHLLVLLEAKEMSLEEVLQILIERNK